jgi:hypothetical protein
MNVGGRGVAGDADPGRGDRPVGGKKGGLNPGGLIISMRPCQITRTYGKPGGGPPGGNVGGGIPIPGGGNLKISTVAL